MKTTTMGVKLDEDVRERLKVLGNIKERTPHWLMKKAIEEYLVKEEVNEREKQEDMVRWQRYQDTGEHLSHDEVRTRLTRLADQARTKAAG
ncbi:MAG: toxin-antitoxin system [Gammaproteobacteria bacterium]|nr:toxin-antitoxin system [Gammaproteobacteria bacterium]